MGRWVVVEVEVARAWDRFPSHRFLERVEVGCKWKTSYADDHTDRQAVSWH
jgi:hypothetical protein